MMMLNVILPVVLFRSIIIIMIGRFPMQIQTDHLHSSSLSLSFLFSITNLDFASEFLHTTTPPLFQFVIRSPPQLVSVLLFFLVTYFLPTFSGTFLTVKKQALLLILIFFVNSGILSYY
ncbi:hypothetical protein C8Q75DRAFT_399781 [Abortiporus biennis]|nr:hypothetical protein C8Q75DRAFT_399781 [Abortiporus biennis]